MRLWVYPSVVRLLVTGATGFLGRRFVPEARRRHAVVTTSRHSIVGGDHVAAQLGDRDETLRLVESSRADVVVHLAAMSNVDECQAQPTAAWRTNVAGTRNLLEGAEQAGADFFYISTDLVFDGRRGGYVEDDRPRGVSVYARTKIDAENLAREYPRACVVRPGIMYGWGFAGGRPGFCQWAIDTLRKGQQIGLFADQYRTPAYVADMCSGILALIDRGAHGTWHLAGPERLSRYEFGQAMCAVFELDASLVNAVAQEQAGLHARRGSDCSLNAEKAIRELGVEFGAVRSGLARMREEAERGWSGASNGPPC